MPIQEYTVVYAKPIDRTDNLVLMIEKDRPARQKGKRNLVGGKIDPGETDPIASGQRELMEEAGLEPAGKSYVAGHLCGTWGVVHCVVVPVLFAEPRPREGETERVYWENWEVVRHDPKVIANLKVSLPLMMAGVHGWVISDEGFSTDQQRHMIGITLDLTR